MRPIVVLLALLGFPTFAGEVTLKVSSGKYDRAPAVVRMSAPQGLAAGSYTITDGKGSLYLQCDGKYAWCVVPELKAGETRALAISKDAPYFKPGHGVEAKKGDIAVDFTVNGGAVLSYNFAKTKLPEGVGTEFERGGYIYPLFTGKGTQVLNDFPADHRHHHGIWHAWTKTEFEGRHPDFWNMGQKLACVEAWGLDATWAGPVYAGLRARNMYRDLKADPTKIALAEALTIRLYNVDPALRIFDFNVTQECASDAPLKLPKYHYGGIGIRGHTQWDAKDVMEFLTSEGKTRANGNETTGRWCAMTGKVDGKPATITIFCHPENFRFPQPMRLNPKEPFFCYAPQQGGEFSIEPGKPYVAKYRIVVTDGVPDTALIEKLWNDYAEPAEVRAE